MKDKTKNEERIFPDFESYMRNSGMQQCLSICYRREDADLIATYMREAWDESDKSTRKQILDKIGEGANERTIKANL